MVQLHFDPKTTIFCTPTAWYGNAMDDGDMVLFNYDDKTKRIDASWCPAGVIVSIYSITDSASIEYTGTHLITYLSMYTHQVEATSLTHKEASALVPFLETVALEEIDIDLFIEMATL